MPPAGRPGASAQREYERRRALRVAAAAARLGRLGVALAWLSGDPRDVAAWRIGAAGEQRLAAQLEALFDDEPVYLLHDRLLGSGRANIDHLAVGPGGVTVIDASNRSGVVRRGRGGFAWREQRLYVGERDHTRLIVKVERQLRAVRATLADADLGCVDVAGALCMVQGNVRGLRRRLYIRDVLVAGPAAIAALTGRDGPLTHAEILAVAWELSVRLPPA